MSPRAACRLEQMGFAEVYDYVPGKSDWLAAGLPREGDNAGVPYAGDLATRDVPTCRLDDPLTAVAQRLRADQLDSCVVVGDDRVVLGRLYADEVDRRPEGRTIAQAMDEGPSTVRANQPVQALLEQLRGADVGEVLLTDPEGRLLGSFSRERARGL